MLYYFHILLLLFLESATIRNTAGLLASTTGLCIYLFINVKILP